MHAKVDFLCTIYTCGAALGLGVLFQDISDRQAAQEAEAAAGKLPQLKLVASNWQFDATGVQSKNRDNLQSLFTLKEGVHAIEIVGLDVKLDKDNPTQEVTFDKPGTYEIIVFFLAAKDMLI